MTQLVSVQTDFLDLEQMAQGLVGRVQANYVILPTGDAVDEGEWAQFEITLHDGSAGLAGVGRCVTLVDNGDERGAHQRYEVVLDSLQFDDHEQQVFHHVLALHGIQPDGVEEAEAVDAESLPAAAGDADVHDGDYVDVSEFTGPHSVQHASEAPEEPTLMASDDEIVAALSNPAVMRPAPGGEANDVVPQQPTRAGVGGSGSGGSGGGGGVGGGSAGGGYVRGGAAHALHPLIEEAREEPLSGERIAPTRSTGGAFAYANGIPFPSKPPRPELDASMRVTPAPRPAGWSGH